MKGRETGRERGWGDKFESGEDEQTDSEPLILQSEMLRVRSLPDLDPKSVDSPWTALDSREFLRFAPHNKDLPAP